MKNLILIFSLIFVISCNAMQSDDKKPLKSASHPCKELTRQSSKNDKNAPSLRSSMSKEQKERIQEDNLLLGTSDCVYKAAGQMIRKAQESNAASAESEVLPISDIRVIERLQQQRTELKKQAKLHNLLTLHKKLSGSTQDGESAEWENQLALKQYDYIAVQLALLTCQTAPDFKIGT